MYFRSVEIRTTAEWEALSTKLFKDVLCVASDTGEFRIGNGVDLWGDTQSFVGAGKSVPASPIIVAHGSATLVAGSVTIANEALQSTSEIHVSMNGSGVLANIGTIYEDKPNRVLTPGSRTFVVKSTNILSNAGIAWMMAGT